MEKPAQDIREEVPSGFFLKIQKSLKEDPHSRPIAFYLGLSLILFFLVFASLAPQIGQRLGLFSQRKEKQEILAQGTQIQAGLKAQPKKEKVGPGLLSGALTPFESTGSAKIAKMETAKTQTPKKAEGELYGKVTDTLGQPISGAQVLIESSTIQTKTTTDELGNYQIKLPPEKYAVQAQKEGLNPQKKPLILTSEEIAIVDFNLNK